MTVPCGARVDVHKLLLFHGQQLCFLLFNKSKAQYGSNFLHSISWAQQRTPQKNLGESKVILGSKLVQVTKELLGVGQCKQTSHHNSLRGQWFLYFCFPIQALHIAVLNVWFLMLIVA